LWKVFMVKAQVSCAAIALFLQMFSTVSGVDAATVDVNGKSISIVAGDEAWLPRLQAMARDLNDDEGLRVLPVASAGCMQSAADVMRLDHIDMALLTTDCVAYAEQQDLLPQATHKLTYVTLVEALPIVIVTRKNIANITALAGQRIATGPAQSAAFATGEMLLGSMGLPFLRVPKSGADGVAALIAGDADAVLLLGLDDMNAKLDPKQFHVFGVTAPVDLAAIYAPALLDQAQLHGLSTESGIETTSTALTLVVRQKPRGATEATRIKNFAAVYFRIAQANGTAAQLSTTILGWKRNTISTAALNALANGAPKKTPEEGNQQ
jgi:hypothetical protein